MWDKVVVGKGREGGGAKGFESAGEGGWKDREEVSLEGERICIPNSTAQSDSKEQDHKKTIQRHFMGLEDCIARTLVLEPMHCTILPGGAQVLK
jgi:hypothetical protein